LIYDKAFSNFPCAIWLKEIRDDEFEQTNSAIPQLVSLVRTLAGAEIQEAVTSHDKNTDSAREPVRCGEEEQVLRRTE
jgi:hypothetical protein